jgi:hypothetical protein
VLGISIIGVGGVEWHSPTERLNYPLERPWFNWVPPKMQKEL